jgi:hypothetical protein
MVDLKHYISDMFRSIVGYHQEEYTSISMDKNKILQNYAMFMHTDWCMLT